MRAPATPSLNDTPWPSALGRLEWVGGGAPCAGDWERGEGAEGVLWGGPLDQADFDGSAVEIFGAEAVEDLLILQRG